MISVPNRPLPLNGNRVIAIIFICLIYGFACPNLSYAAVKLLNSSKNKIFDTSKVSTISLLLPFGTDHLQASSPFTPGRLKETSIAVDYYNGFKLALDSITSLGYNFKLQVFDTKDQVVTTKLLAQNANIKSGNLVVGPVFPDGIKSFTFNFMKISGPMVVSPLSASSPTNYKYSGLITVIPPLEYHAVASAKYINDKLKPTKIYILKSGSTDEIDYIKPFSKAVDSLSGKQTQIIALTVINGQLNSLLPQLSKSDQNIFVVPSIDHHFLNVTLNALDSLNLVYPVAVIGHPSWVNLDFLRGEQLQRINTLITSTDLVDYKALNTINFLKLYKKTYKLEATPYAIKGYDEGLYFGKLLATRGLDNIGEIDFTGLHNSFHFQKIEGYGWVNTHVEILKYVNFELKKVE